MILGALDHGLRAPFAQHRIGGGVVSDRRGRRREVRDVEEDLALPGVEHGDGGIEFLHPAPERFHLRFESRAVLLRGAELPDFLAEAVAFGLEALEAGVRRAAFPVDRQHGVHGGFVAGAARGEAGFDGVGVFANESNIEHELDRMNKIGTMG